MTAVQETPTDVVPPEVERQRRRAADRARELVHLMERRPDLYGVHREAELAVESILWSA
ncbi:MULTISPECIES: hypothetical protein [unclassified Nocardioides]|uniref:hypothetical protein n=1 Tax=unclassified Nocardioides TaxID=2615069 RepID=UPI00360BC7F9